MHDDAPAEHVLQAAAAVRQQHRQEAQQQREGGEAGPMSRTNAQRGREGASSEARRTRMCINRLPGVWAVVDQKPTK